MKNGEIPENKQVLHKCDNRLCVNPEHLWLGTTKDNMQDKMHKKRQWGEAVGTSKLTTKQVGDIIQLRRNGETLKSIGLQYGVDHSSIWKIVHRVSWKNVTAC